MRDTKDIEQEFSRWTGHPNPPRPLQTYWYDTDAMFQEIARLRTRVAWLENELDHAGNVVGSVTMYEKYPEPMYRTKMFEALKTYWEQGLEDDGTEP